MRGNGRGVARIVDDIERTIFHLPGDLRTRYTDRDGWCFPSQVPDGPPGTRGNRVVDAPPGTSTKALARLRARLDEQYYKGYMEITRGLPQEDDDPSHLDESSMEASSNSTSSAVSDLRSPDRKRESWLGSVTPRRHDNGEDQNESSGDWVPGKFESKQFASSTSIRYATSSSPFWKRSCVRCALRR